MSVCVSVCPRGYLRNHMLDPYQFLCMLPMSVARSSSGMLTIGRIAYRREGAQGSAQRGRSVIYDCLVMAALRSRCGHYIFALSFVLSSFFSSPNLSRRRLNVCHTCIHGLALV